jgi:hypothetical protein
MSLWIPASVTLSTAAGSSGPLVESPALPRWARCPPSGVKGDHEATTRFRLVSRAVIPAVTAWCCGRGWRPNRSASAAACRPATSWSSGRWPATGTSARSSNVAPAGRCCGWATRSTSRSTGCSLTPSTTTGSATGVRSPRSAGPGPAPGGPAATPTWPLPSPPARTGPAATTRRCGIWPPRTLTWSSTSATTSTRVASRPMADTARPRCPRCSNPPRGIWTAGGCSTRCTASTPICSGPTPGSPGW